MIYYDLISCMTETDNKLIDQKITCDHSQGGTNSSVVVDGEQQIPLANALGFDQKFDGNQSGKSEFKYKKVTFQIYP